MMDERKREKVIVRTSIIGILGNILLVGFKAFIGFLAGSVAIIMDAVNNLTDVLSSVVTIIGAKISNKKPDKKHPFGHGRVEYVTSFIISFIILAAGVIAIYESILSIVDYFQNGTMPNYEIWSLIIIGAAVLVKVGIGIFFRIQGKKVDSASLKASGVDALFDALLSTATLVGAIFSYTLGWYVEGYLGILIGAFIIRTGITILKESISSIIGERHDAEEIKNIIADINSVPGVLGAYDLIINNYGHQKNVGSVHIGVKSDLTAREIQVIERNINILLYEKYHIFMTVGIYADSEDSEDSRVIRQKISSLIKDNKNILQLHGFFLDDEHHICNFDLVFSFDEKEPEQVISIIKLELEKEFPQYQFIIQLDKDYSLS